MKTKMGDSKWCGFLIPAHHQNTVVFYNKRRYQVQIEGNEYLYDCLFLDIQSEKGMYING